MTEDSRNVTWNLLPVIPNENSYEDGKTESGHSDSTIWYSLAFGMLAAALSLFLYAYCYCAAWPKTKKLIADEETPLNLPNLEEVPLHVLIYEDDNPDMPRLASSLDAPPKYEEVVEGLPSYQEAVKAPPIAGEVTIDYDHNCF